MPMSLVITGGHSVMEKIGFRLFSVQKIQCRITPYLKFPIPGNDSELLDPSSGIGQNPKMLVLFHPTFCCVV